MNWKKQVNAETENSGLAPVQGLLSLVYQGGNLQDGYVGVPPTNKVR